ncbi:MAG: MOSC N-terminal beta barrel domain-containing protein [Martelella sp.]|uniref:MOSC domain-containing protein n=1 Tax=Martelella sp. TaxID=1969699 RepID=UPI00324214BE
MGIEQIPEYVQEVDMEPLGEIIEIWRYPVSSLGGERLTSAVLGSDGIAFDRAWCICDAETGAPAAPEKELRWRPALFLGARLGEDNRPEIGFPDGGWTGVDDAGLAERLAAHFGFAVDVRPYARNADDSGPVAVNRYLPSPIHLVTTDGLKHLATLAGTDEVSSRRFRPNVVLKTPGLAGFPEKEWVTQRLQLGKALIVGFEETRRCGMTIAPQPDIAENADILRSLLRHNRRNFGIYCTIEEPGFISTGDIASRAA